MAKGKAHGMGHMITLPSGFGWIPGTMSFAGFKKKPHINFSKETTNERLNVFSVSGPPGKRAGLLIVKKDKYS